MASNLGTVYVELSLDDKVYKQKLGETLTSTQTTAKGIETSWKALGSKSEALFNQQRLAAENAYTLIKNSAKSTANDIVRAEEAKNAKIMALNEQQFGKQTSLLQTLKANWIAATAAIYASMVVIRKAWDVAEQAAHFEEMKIGLAGLSARYDKTASDIIKMSKEAVNGQLSMMEAGKLAARAFALGLNPQQIKEFLTQAERLKDVMQGSIPDAFEAMERAAATGRARGLVQYGINVDLTKSLKQYADAHGIAVSAISASNAMQIRSEEIMKAVKVVTDQVGETAMSTADRMNVMRATIADVNLLLGQGTIRVAMGVMGVFQGLAAAALVLVDGFMRIGQGMENLKGLVTFGEESKKHYALADIMGSDARAAMAAAEDLAAKGKANFDAMTASTDDLAMAMKRLTPAISENGEELSAGAKKVEELKKHWEEMKMTLEATIEGGGMSQFKKNLIDNQLETDKLTDKFGKLKGAIDLIKKAQEAKDTDAAKKAEKIALDAVEKRIDEETARDKKQYNDAIKLQKDRSEAAREILKDMKGYEQDYYNESLKLIEEQAQKFRELKMDELAVTKWVEEQKRKATLQLNRSGAGGTFSEGWDEGIKEWGKDAFNMFVQAEKMSKATAQSMSSNFSNLFFDVMTGKFEGFQSYFKSFTDSLLKSFTNMLADMVTKWIMEMAKMMAMKAVAGLGGLFGGGGFTDSQLLGGQSFHSGGIVGYEGSFRYMPAYAYANAPRYHSGFQPDEYPVVLQKGEGVFTKKQMSSMGGSLTVNVPINGIDNKKMVADLKNSIESTVVSVMKRHS